MPLSVGLDQAGNEIPKWQLADLIAELKSEACLPFFRVLGAWEVEGGAYIGQTTQAQHSTRLFQYFCDWLIEGYVRVHIQYDERCQQRLYS